MKDHSVATITPGSTSILLPLSLGSLLLVVNVGHTVFAQMAALPDGSFPFHESSAVLVAEFAKMILALALLGGAWRKADAQEALSSKFQPTKRIVLEMAVPGLLYTLSNILSYTTIGLLGSTQYQLFSNLKIVITAITFRLVIQKRLKVIQWVSLVFLTTGLLVATTSNQCNKAADDMENDNTDSARTLWGIILMVLLSLASSFAGVFSELRLKGAPQHPMLQNALMYAWSVLFCLVQYHYKSHTTDLGSGFFQGFSWSLWGAIWTTAIYGQVVALVFYYCDNIVKVFANSATVIASALMDQILFDDKPLTVQIGIAASIILCSTVVYYGDHSLLLKDDVELVPQRAITSGGEPFSFAGRSKHRWIAGLLGVAFLFHWSTSSFQGPTKGIHNQPCDWPPPLYKPRSKQATRPDPYLVRAMQQAKQFFDRYSKTTFSYIDSGGALGLYRDGSLIPGDSDLDVRFAICTTCRQAPRDRFPAVDNNFVSPNKYSTFGDLWTRRETKTPSNAQHIQKVQKDLCLHEWAPGKYYWFHKNDMQRKAFQYTYGDFWFVRMPWKGVHNVHTWYEYAQIMKGELDSIDGFHGNWIRSLESIQEMDKDGDGFISEKELKARVLADGMIPERYQKDITPRERCRAATMLTFLLQFQADPYEIPEQEGGLSNGDIPLFAFKSCDQVDSQEGSDAQGTRI